MAIRITGGSWWCCLCNEFHCEGDGCPRLPSARRGIDIERELKEVIRKIIETENVGNEKAEAAKM